MSHAVKTIALTIGDPNGIGPEIAVKAAAALRGYPNISVILVGDEHVVRHYGGSSNGIRLHAVDALPRIGVFGINPHAGENGLFGDDDDRITAPAVDRLRKAGINVEGPVGADVILGRKDIDGFVAIYHDHGHIPVKLMAGRNVSALSVGAGVLFSSVGHGSAFDIAGQGNADPAAVLRTLGLVGNLPAEPARSTAAATA